MSFIGYKQKQQQLVVNSDLDLNLTLEPGSILADEVIVMATRAGENTPTTYTTVDQEYLEKQNFGQDLPFLLNFMPSVVVTSDAGAGIGYTGIRIRGSDPTKVNVTINGIPYNDAESLGTFWVNMPDFASSVDNIQMQRGVGTSTNGAGAFGASLNIQTTTLNEEPYAEIDNSFGSFNTRRHSIRAGTGLINDRFTLDARLSSIYSDGYVDRAFSDLKSFFVSGGYYGKSSLLKVNVFSGVEQTYQSWYGVPEAALDTNRTFNYYTYDNQTDNYQQDHYQVIYAKDINNVLTLNTALHYTRGRGYYEEYRENDLLNFYGISDIEIGDTIISRSELIRRRWLDNHFYGFTYSAIYNPTDRLELVFGGGWNRYDGDHFGEVIWSRFAGDSEIRDRYYENNGLKTDFNSYLKGYYQITPHLNGFADLQIRTINYSFFGYDDDLSNVQQDDQLRFFNPKIGLTYNPAIASQIYASYSIGNKEPARIDYVTSTPTRRPLPETLRNVEIGFRRQTSRYSLNANYYLMDYKNQLVLTGEINDVGAYTRTNIDRSYRSGIELETGIMLNNRWKLRANATFSRNKIRNFSEFIDNYDEGGQLVNNYQSTDISFSPNIIAGSELNYRLLDNFFISLFSKYVGEQYLDNTSDPDRMLDDYLINDLRIRYTIHPRFLKELTFSLLVNNIFNVKYEANGYTFSYKYGGEVLTENYYYPQAGTNLLGAVILKF
jgi:iron complex outermembrane receptor protein